MGLSVYQVEKGDTLTIHLALLDSGASFTGPFTAVVCLKVLLDNIPFSLIG